MKFLLLTAALALLSLPVLGSRPQESHRGISDFCYTGWVRTSHSSLDVGNGCFYVEDEYHCDDSGEDIICHHLYCPDGSGTAEVCEQD